MITLTEKRTGSTVLVIDHRGRPRPFAAIERDVINLALAACDGNKKLAAVLLGIGRSALYRKLAAIGYVTPEWVAYKPGDPLPAGRVRVRQDQWESKTASTAAGWVGWDDGTIIAYLPIDGENQNDL